MSRLLPGAWLDALLSVVAWLIYGPLDAIDRWLTRRGGRA